MVGEKKRYAVISHFYVCFGYSNPICTMGEVAVLVIRLIIYMCFVVSKQTKSYNKLHGNFTYSAFNAKGWCVLKNNIIIAGVPRAGKSTISHRLSKTFGYQHVSMDSINAGLERCFPELGIDTSGADSSFKALATLSAKIAPFIRAMLDSGEYDEFKPGMVLDVFQLLPEDYMKYLHVANCEIHYFITSDVTADERLALLKKYDNPNHYTFYKPEDELRKKCANIVEISKLVKKQCEKFNLPYYETAKDRDKVFEQFIARIDKTNVGR